jgi:peptide/nickel transport system substrate-binding protein
MFKQKAFGLFVIATLLLTACAQAAPTPQVIIQTQIVEVQGTPQVQEVVVTATAAPAPVVEFLKDDPTTFSYMVFGDIDTLDPNLAYDTASAEVIQNVMEPLITFNREDATSFVPLLAEEVPSLENGGISADGLTYTFNIRQGVKFHNGNDLTPSDFAYTFWRGLLQSDPNSAQWLLLEPIMGYSSGDVTEEIGEGAYAGDREALIANATPEELAAVCEKAKAAVVADDGAGTLTFNLGQPWGPLLATLAQTWGAALDKEWAIENGAWDGDCATWQNFYAPGSENDELSNIINGTGPYMLDHWTPGEEWVLVANENYWRPDGEPMWEGGPSGAPKIKRIVTQIVEEWGTRFAAFQAGDADAVEVNLPEYPQVDAFVGEICDVLTGQCASDPNHPDAPLLKWDNQPGVQRTDMFLNFNVATDEAGNNPYIGSGQLDGNGVPADFFADEDVRLAFNYCFDYDTYVADGMNGRGVRNSGVIILDMLGYNPDQEMYNYDLAKCEEHLAKAWGGVLPETGFRLQVTFNTGNTQRQTVAEILQNNLASINELYRIEIVGLPWPTLLRSFRARQLPVAVSGWLEDIHDPHNWVQPYFIGTFAGRQNLPDELKAQFADQIDQAVHESDPAKREALYFQMGQLRFERVPNIVLAQPTTAQYLQRWVKGYYYNPLATSIGLNWYAYEIAGK